MLNFELLMRGRKILTIGMGLRDSERRRQLCSPVESQVGSSLDIDGSRRALEGQVAMASIPLRDPQTHSLRLLHIRTRWG